MPILFTIKDISLTAGTLRAVIATRISGYKDALYFVRAIFYISGAILNTFNPQTKL